MNKSKLVLSITLALFSFFAFANSPSMVWIKGFDQNGITVYYNVETCNGKDMIYFRVENKTNEARKINITGSIKDATNNQNILMELFLESNKSIVTNCGDLLTPISCCRPLLFKFNNPIVTVKAQ